MRKAAAAKEATMVKWKQQGQCYRGEEARGQCNQMAQNLQKLHKHTLPERTHAAHAATATATATCNARENLCQGAAKPCRQRRVAECRVWTLAYCVRVQLRRLSQQHQQDEGSRSSLGRGGGTGGDSANSFYCCCYSSPALASLLRMLFPSCCCCFCSSPALILAMALRFCRVRFAALTVHQCGPGGQLAAMVLRLPQTLVPSPASSPASTAAAPAAAACCLSVCAPLYLAPSSSAVAAAASAPVSQRRHHR